PPIAQASNEEPDQSATLRAPVTRKAALAPGAVRAIERPTTVTKKSEAEPASRSERAKSENTRKPSKVAKPASSQPPKVDRELSEDIPAEGLVSAEAEKTQGPGSKTRNNTTPSPFSKRAAGGGLDGEPARPASVAPRRRAAKNNPAD